MNKKLFFRVNVSGLLEVRNFKAKLLLFKKHNGQYIEFINDDGVQYYVGGGTSKLRINEHGDFMVVYQVNDGDHKKCNNIDISFNEDIIKDIDRCNKKSFFKTIHVNTTDDNYLLDVECKVHSISIHKPACANIKIKTSVGTISLPKGISDFSTEFNTNTDIRPIEIFGDNKDIIRTTIFVQHN